MISSKIKIKLLYLLSVASTYSSILPVSSKISCPTTWAQLEQSVAVKSNGKASKRASIFTRWQRQQKNKEKEEEMCLLCSYNQNCERSGNVQWSVMKIVSVHSDTCA